MLVKKKVKIKKTVPKHRLQKNLWKGSVSGQQMDQDPHSHKTNETFTSKLGGHVNNASNHIHGEEGHGGTKEDLKHHGECEQRDRQVGAGADPSFSRI